MVYYHYDQNTGDYKYTYYDTGEDKVYKNYNLSGDSLRDCNEIKSNGH